jgi:uncharacterized protein (DUF433 family)
MSTDPRVVPGQGDPPGADRLTNGSGEPAELGRYGGGRSVRVYSPGMDPLLSRITIDPSICHGKPCIRGLRYPVETILELLSSGMTPDEILADYEDLEPDDLPAAIAFAARLARTRRLVPVGP